MASSPLPSVLLSNPQIQIPQNLPHHLSKYLTLPDLATDKMKQKTLLVCLLTAAVVFAETKACVAVTYYSNDQCQGRGTFTTNVYDTTGLFSSTIGVDSAQARSVRITGGEQLPHSNCVLHLFSDDACQTSAGTIGPISQDGGFPVSW
ncbi:hypothetical protein MBLNU13_g00547t1 [Cladosporium sp. NU13]